MSKQISREQANKLLIKTSAPHDARFKSKDVNKELKYKFLNNGKATLKFDQMLPKEAPMITFSSKSDKKRSKNMIKIYKRNVESVR
jgi:hypothetical protein